MNCKSRKYTNSKIPVNKEGHFTHNHPPQKKKLKRRNQKKSVGMKIDGAEKREKVLR